MSVKRCKKCELTLRNETREKKTMKNTASFLQKLDMMFLNTNSEKRLNYSGIYESYQIFISISPFKRNPDR